MLDILGMPEGIDSGILWMPIDGSISAMGLLHDVTKKEKLGRCVRFNRQTVVDSADVFVLLLRSINS